MNQLKIDVSAIQKDENIISASQKAKWSEELQRYCDNQAQTVGEYNGYCMCGIMEFCGSCELVGNRNNCVKAIKVLAKKKKIEIDYLDFDFEKLIKKLEERK